MKRSWSSLVCCTSGTDICTGLLLSLLALALISCVSASTIQAGMNIQAAVEKAHNGDNIIVGPGKYDPFEVNKALRIVGVGWPVIQAAIQLPGITVSSDDAQISGFKIKGVAEDSTAKFDYYMQHSFTTGLRLNLPNAAIIVQGNNVVLQDDILYGPQVGVYADGIVNSSIVNVTFDHCGMGVELLNSLGSRIINSRSSSCDKSGINIEHSSNILVDNNSIIDTRNSGILLKASEVCRLSNNTASGNNEGIVLWNSSLNNVQNNRVDRNYYGILVSGSNNNTILDNVAWDNSRSEIVNGFGVGISLQENSSYNMIARNIASKNRNGLELIRGCKYNVIFSNNATDNTHGIRVDKNYNNLIYHNNFIGNTINAYDNSTHNFWNASVGNYYSDYHGTDKKRDGMGDQPYAIPMGNTKSMDYRPLTKPCSTAFLDLSALRKALVTYARYDPEGNQPYHKAGGTMIIGFKRPTSPPEWSESNSDFNRVLG